MPYYIVKFRHCRTKMNPPAEGQEKDVLLVLDKQQGKVSAVKGIDNEGNLQTVEPTQSHSGEFMQVDRNSDVFSNFISNFFRRYQDTEGLALFRSKATEAEQDAKAIEDNHRNPTPGGATDGRKCCEFRIPTITGAGRTTVSTRLKSRRKSALPPTL